MEMDQIIKLIQEVSDSNLTLFKYSEGNLSLELSKLKDNTKGVNKHSDDAKYSEDTKQSEDENRSNRINDYEVIGINDVQKNKNVKDTEKDISDKFVVKSPIVGTFYSSPSEEGDPFVEVGDRVKKGQVIAIIEAMKIMNEIEAAVDGVVHEILVKNQDVVEFGQPLVVIKP